MAWRFCLQRASDKISAARNLFQQKYSLVNQEDQGNKKKLSSVPKTEGGAGEEYDLNLWITCESSLLSAVILRLRKTLVRKKRQATAHSARNKVTLIFIPSKLSQVGDRLGLLLQTKIGVNCFQKDERLKNVTIVD